MSLDTFSCRVACVLPNECVVALEHHRVSKLQTDELGTKTKRATLTIKETTLHENAMKDAFFAIKIAAQARANKFCYIWAFEAI